MPVVIPFRAGTNLWRARSFRVVRQHLLALAPIRVDFREDMAFNKSAAINNAVDKLSPRGGGILVVNDADSIVPLEQVDEMIRVAHRTGGLAVGYTDYLRLTQAATFNVLEKHHRSVEPDWPSLDLEWAQANAPSIGCMAITLEAFQEVGGFDERFEGWGPEDIDFAQRCLATVGVERIPGPLYHLWHDERRPDDSPVSASAQQVARNLEHFRRKHTGQAA